MTASLTNASIYSIPDQNLIDMSHTNAIGKVRQYLVTSYYLKPSQIWHRIRMTIHARVMHKSDRYLRSFTRSAGQEEFQPVSFPDLEFATVDIAQIKQGTFVFLNKKVELGSPINWLPDTETKLWIYNLHYFDHARELARHYKSDHNKQHYLLFKSLVEQWIDACPVAMPVAWDAYPISLRINNWLRAYSVFANFLSEDKTFASQLRASLYNQALYLEKHLELQLQNNHLLENGRSLWLASIFFNSSDSDRWRAIGSNIIWKGLDDNFFDDGGHDELSPMYHQIMLDMYKEIAAVAQYQQLETPSHLNERLVKMQNWLVSVLHPDERLPLFNDSAHLIAASPTTSIDSSITCSDGLTALPDSGYFMLRDKKNRNFLIFDAGLMGADHRSGHSHCDILSYELSIAGRRLIIDSGVSDYFKDPATRNYFRSTRAHNTVVIDGEEQSQIWDVFRVARRARPRQAHWAEDDNLQWVSASHTGYERLTNPVFHNRKIAYVDSRFWIIIDKLTASGQHVAESFIHFHPSTVITNPPQLGENKKPGKVAQDSNEIQIHPWGYESCHSYHGETNPMQGWYASEFGKEVENTVWGLKTAFQEFCWSGYVVWPDATQISLDVITHKDGLQLSLHDANKGYKLTISDSKISAEIDPMSDNVPVNDDLPN